MNWAEAVQTMRKGQPVHRTSQVWRVQVGEAGGLPVFDCGREACMLAAAWTDDERPVMVFRGAESGVLFVPDDEDRAAEDWATA